MLRLISIFFLVALAQPAFATEAAWARLVEGGHTVLLFHTTAPGMGDPTNFNLNDCATQRNLSEDGKQQAQRIGAQLAARAIKVDRILTSQWCRAKDTARFVFPKITAIEVPALNSFFADPASKDRQTNAVADLIKSFESAGNQFMITHQVNITALTGLVPREGEMIIVDADGSGKIIALGRQSFN